MDSGKKEISAQKTDLKKYKKSKTRKLFYWLLIDISVAIIVFALLLYRPGRYRPFEATFDSNQTEQIDIDITNKLGPEVYDNFQSGKPFDVVITEDVLNYILKLVDWPIENNGVMLYAPAGLLLPGTIVLMGTADIEGVELIVTIEIKPQINDKGLLNMHVAAVKVGALNLTPLAKTMAKKMYTQKLTEVNADMSALKTRIVASLLNEEPFDPVFSIEKKSLRLENFNIEKGQITAHIVPYKPASTPLR